MKLLTTDKPCRLLQAISMQNGKKSISEIGKNVYATYKSRWEVVSEFELKGLVYTEKFGREVVPYLTPLGKAVLEKINYILAI